MNKFDTSEWPVQPRKCGKIDSDGGWAFYCYAIFRREDVEKYLECSLDSVKFNPEKEEYEESFELDVAAELTGWFYYYNGPGRWFGENPIMKWGKRNVYVRQFRGMDV